MVGKAGVVVVHRTEVVRVLLPRNEVNRDDIRVLISFFLAFFLAFMAVHKGAPFSASLSVEIPN